LDESFQSKAILRLGIFLSKLLTFKKHFVDQQVPWPLIDWVSLILRFD